MAPLTKLREAAVSVSEGNYDIQVPAEGDTELAQVGKSFNQMSSKVKEQIECLSTVNHTQRQLMGSLAHELKTPMTSYDLYPGICRYPSHSAPAKTAAGESSLLYFQ